MALPELHLFFHQEVLSWISPRTSGIYLGLWTSSSLNRASGKQHMHSMLINSGCTDVISRAVCNQSQVRWFH